MSKMKLGKYSILWLCAISVYGQSEMPNKQLSRTQVVMGTFCTITLDANATKKIDEGFSYLKKIESVLSSYQKDALVSRLNHQKSVPSDTVLKDILEKSKKYHQFTDGYFDITIGSITKKLYHFGEKENIPAQKEIQNAVLGIEKITIGVQNITLEDNITIDLGGIGKGYGVDKLSDYYHGQGIDKGKIALSGDIRCLDRCSIGIQDPFDEDKTVTILQSKISDLAISTSGTYRRYVKTDKHHHLVNPKSRIQSRAFVSVTIIAEADNTFCDAVATAVGVMPKATALEFVKSQKKFAYLLVTSDGKLISGNLDKFVYSDKRVQNKQQR